jgi:hypothetical protein
MKTSSETEWRHSREREVFERTESLSSSKEGGDPHYVELKSENRRLQHLVADLLMRNQELRERARMQNPAK